MPSRLPDGSSAENDAVWAVYDGKLAPLAVRLATARLRQQARKACEQLMVEPLSVRHERARADRRFWVEPAEDGMAWLGGLLPAADAYRARARVKANAKHLATQPGETRTRAQIEADILSDLLTGDGTEYAVRATVGVTVPVLTAIDASGLGPGMMEGYGPIDPQSARRLTARAPSFFRILTDPVTSAVVDVDRASYRPPADLKRWVRLTHPICAFPGCGRAASECDIDHSQDWAHGGKTAFANLAPLCRGNHRDRHRTKWKLIRADDGTITWLSPLGRRYDEDPPPF